MKKRIILASIILALIPLAIRAIDQPKYSLLEANVEALLTPETGGEVVKCYCKTHWFSPNVCSANADGAYCGGDPCSNHDGNCR